RRAGPGAGQGAVRPDAGRLSRSPAPREGARSAARHRDDPEPAPRAVRAATAAAAGGLTSALLDRRAAGRPAGAPSAIRLQQHGVLLDRRVRALASPLYLVALACRPCHIDLLQRRVGSSPTFTSIL